MSLSTNLGAGYSNSDWPATKARQGVGQKYRRIERIRRSRRVWAEEKLP